MMIIQKHLEVYGNIEKKIPAVNNDLDIADFDGTNATDSFNFKTKITSQTDDDGRMDNVEIMVPLKYLSNF